MIAKQLIFSERQGKTCSFACRAIPTVPTDVWRRYGGTVSPNFT